MCACSHEHVCSHVHMGGCGCTVPTHIDQKSQTWRSFLRGSPASAFHTLRLQAYSSMLSSLCCCRGSNSDSHLIDDEFSTGPHMMGGPGSSRQASFLRHSEETETQDRMTSLSPIPHIIILRVGLQQLTVRVQTAVCFLQPYSS